MFRQGSLAAVTGLIVLISSAQADGPLSRYLPPQRPEIPKVQNKSWCVNPIDAFVSGASGSRRLGPVAARDKLRLLRRVTFDLTGLAAHARRAGRVPGR